TLTVFPGEYTIVVKKEDIIVREKVKIENIPKAEYYVVVKKEEAINTQLKQGVRKNIKTEHVP
ncbi:MAG: hypothetical protein DRP67_02480, partial [Candidatus Omnitrophota bacterium]